MRLHVMRLAPVLGVILHAGPAFAAPPKYYDLPTTPAKVELFGSQLEYFKVTAATPVLTAQINAEIADDAHVFGIARLAGNTTYDIGCTPGLVTSVFVSWTCSGSLASRDGGTAPVHTAHAYFIENGALVVATRGKLLVADFDTRAVGKQGEDGCTVQASMEHAITSDGLMLFDESSRCTIPWEDARPLLAKSVLATVAEADEANVLAVPDLAAAWGKAPARFATQAGGVLDRATGLVWAAADNGADLDHAAAVKFAASYAGGDFKDWRLPTDEELQGLADPALAHREKADCTRGKNAFVVTPLVKLSCGLAWSSTAAGNGYVGFGFISGTPRISKAAEKTNYRALVVREP